MNDPLLHKHIRVPLGDLRAVAIIRHQQFHRIQTVGFPLQTGGHLLRKLIAGSLCGVANLVLLLSALDHHATVFILADPFQQPALFQCVQQPEHNPFVERRSRDQIAQTQNFIRCGERLQHSSGVGYRLNEVWVAAG